MKIITHTFKKDDQIEVVNGEFCVTPGAETTAHFRFVGRSAYVFEKEYGKGLLEVFGSLQDEREIFGLLTYDIIRALCKASFIDMENPNDADAGAMAFERAGFDGEFINDTDFVMELMDALIDFMKVAPQDHKKSQPTKKGAKGKEGKKH